MPLNHLLILLELSISKKEKHINLFKNFKNKPKWNRGELSYNPNITLEFILRDIAQSRQVPTDSFYEDKFCPGEWDWYGISSNPCITMNDILDQAKPDLLPISSVNHPELPWDWSGISCNPNITIDFILKNIDKPLVWWKVIENPSITTIDNILKYPGFPWKWKIVSRHSNITVKNILDHPELPWVWKEFSWNDNITVDFMLEHPRLPTNKREKFKDWNWSGVSKNPNITMEFVIDHLVLNKGPVSFKKVKPESLSWIWTDISHNPGVKFDDVLKYLQYASQTEFHRYGSVLLDDGSIVFKKLLSEENISSPKEGKISLRWNWWDLSYNPNITLSNILDNLALFDGTSPVSNPNKDPDWSWDWHNVSSNDNITFEDIMNNQEFPFKKAEPIPWEWSSVSYNCNLTYKDILNNPDAGQSPDKSWSWRDISGNLFNRYNAAIIIQRFYRKHGAFPRWKRAIKDTNIAILYNPKIGGLEFLREKKLVEREYNDE